MQAVRVRAQVLCAALATSIAGCAGAAKQAAKEAAPEAVESAAEEASQPHVTEDVAQLLETPRIRSAAAGFAAAVTAGALAGLADPRLAAQLQAVPEQLADRAARSFEQAMAPVLERAVAGAVDAAIREATSDEARAALSALAADTARATVRAMAEGVAQELGPALQESLENDVGPGLTAMIDPPFAQRVGLLAREVSRESVVGAEAGLAAVPEAATLLGRVERLLSRGALLLLVLAALAGLVGLTLLAVLPWQWHRLRKARAELDRREEALLLVAHALKTTEGRPWSPELREALRHELRDGAGAEYVRDVLRRHPDLRMGH